MGPTVDNVWSFPRKSIDFVRIYECKKQFIEVLDAEKYEMFASLRQADPGSNESVKIMNDYRFRADTESSLISEPLLNSLE